MEYSPDVFATLPSPSLFVMPPRSEPAFLAPPSAGSFGHPPPFHIAEHIYQAALDPRVPLTIAALYAVSAKALNRYNISRGKKPWAISKTRAFFAFVVLHNVFLAVYSAWTFLGMLGAVRRSFVSPLGPHGLTGTIDSMCKMSGPAGLGRAVFWDEGLRGWTTLAEDVGLAADGRPLAGDEGRVWNEGLAFYGWLFYLSKFYEVLDTFIILAKGKLSSTLQTYHHAGAMMCMWAGMRYMASPIWMFVFFNSAIHAMMYTYYTITAFNIRVPTPIKQTLTSLQITQFVVGSTYAMAHSFVSYVVPVVTTVTTTAAAAPASSQAPAAEATRAALIDTLKSLVFRSAAAAQQQQQQQLGGTAASTTTTTTTVHSTQLVPCVTTTGQTFAIWLNVLYLAPLTWLFVKFFITSYLRRSPAVAERSRRQAKARAASGLQGSGAAGRAGEASSHVSDVVAAAESAGWEAARNVEREVYGQGDGGDSPVSEGSPAAARDAALAAALGGSGAEANGSGRVLRSRS